MAMAMAQSGKDFNVAISGSADDLIEIQEEQWMQI
jgi:hypothetical protein